MKTILEFPKDVSGKIVSLSYDDPRIKLNLVREIIRSFNQSNQQVQYVDLDLQYSSMLMNLRTGDKETFPKAEVLAHVTEEIIDILEIVKSSRRGGIVIIDTLNTLQNLMLYGKLNDTAVANHRTAVLISLFEDITRFYSKALLLLNLTRSRPRKIIDSVLWEKGIIGGRITRFKSDLMLFASVDPSAIESQSLILEVVLPKKGYSTRYSVLTAGADFSTRL